MADASVDSEGIIQVMPETLANKIAAGEVVQRPASVLKELMENAIDAGAHHIDVHAKSAGRDLVQVVDDGSGMSANDAQRCFQRHATSKIRSAEDLMRIQTLGFRGEALASIAAVARVALKTKRAQDEAGTQVRVEGGEVVSQQPCATPDGTSVAVQNLFYNVPARRNFLKTRATELKHLIETFQFLALSNPELAFSFSHEGREMYRLQPARTDEDTAALRHRIGELFEEAYKERLVEVGDAASYLAVRGLVGTPECTRRSRGEQFLFVNGRYVESRYLSHAVKAAYGDMLPDGAFPFFALFIEAEPSRVDINVHPRKAEVKFDDESGVYGFLKDAVKRAMGRANLTPQLDEGEDAGTSSEEEPQAAPPPESRPRSFRPLRTSQRSEDEPSRSSTSPSSRKSSPERSASGRSAQRPPGELTEALYSESPPDTASASPEQAEAPEGDAAALWQVQDRYLLKQTPDGLLFVDQHEAHKRILYEQALRHLEEERGPSQQLLFPFTLDLNPADYALLEELLPRLKALGFELEPLSGRSVVVRGLPADLQPAGDEEGRSVLEDVLEQYQSNRDTLKLKGRENLAKSIAVRGAIQPGTTLAPEARRALLKQLFACEMPYASPSGSATLINISAEEVAKRFRQKGA